MKKALAAARAFALLQYGFLAAKAATNNKTY